MAMDESLLRSDAAVLCGGRDMNGNPLIIFPVTPATKLEQLGTASLVQLIRYYGNVAKLGEQVQGFAFLADLQTCNQETIQILADTLTALQTEKQGMVASLYVLRSKSGSKHRFMKKVLGLKESKKCPRVPLYKTVVLKSHAELYAHISRNNVTEDFGGTLRHNQEAWIRFHKMIGPLTDTLHRLIPRIPAARDKVTLLHEYEASATTMDELTSFLKDLQHKYNGIISDLALESTIDSCHELIQQLDKPNDPFFHHLPTSLVLDTKAHINVSMTTLISARGELVESWKEVENSVTVRLQLAKYRDQATQLNTQILDDWLAKVEVAPILSYTLSQAETHRNTFLTSVYEPSKEIIGKATTMLKGVQDVKVSTKCDFSFVEGLSKTVHVFAEKLEKNNKIYISLHIFFLMFEKLALWYQKVLRFLPSSLSRHAERARRKKQSAFPVLPKWTQAARSFLDKHPSPREEHILRIDKPNVELPDQQICTQAKLLAQRIRILMRILSSNEHFSTTDVVDSLTWKKSVQKGEDAIIIPHDSTQQTTSDIDSARDNTSTADLLQRPSTALGISEKKNTVTFASDVADGATVPTSPIAKKPQTQSNTDLNKSLDTDEFLGLDFRRHSISVEKHHANNFVDDDRNVGKYWKRSTRSHSIDNLVDMSNFRESRNIQNTNSSQEQERFISLNFQQNGQNFHENPGSYQIFPEHFHGDGENIDVDSSMAESGDGSGVVLRLQDIMNSSMAPERKVQQAQMLLQQQEAQKTPRLYKQADKHKQRTSKMSPYNSDLTKSLPNLDQVDNPHNPVSYLCPPAYNNYPADSNPHHEYQNYDANQNSQYKPEFYSPTQNYHHPPLWQRSISNVDDWMRRQQQEQTHEQMYESDDGFSDGSQLAPVLKRQLQRLKDTRRSSHGISREGEVMNPQMRDDHRNQQEYYLRRHKLQKMPAERRRSCPLYVTNPTNHETYQTNNECPAPDSDQTLESTDRGYVSSDVFLRDHPFRRSRPRKSGGKGMTRKMSNDSVTSSDMSFMNHHASKASRVSSMQFNEDDELDDSAPVDGFTGGQGRAGGQGHVRNRGHGEVQNHGRSERVHHAQNQGYDGINGHAQNRGHDEIQGHARSHGYDGVQGHGKSHGDDEGQGHNGGQADDSSQGHDRSPDHSRSFVDGLDNIGRDGGWNHNDVQDHEVKSKMAAGQGQVRGDVKGQGRVKSEQVKAGVKYETSKGQGCEQVQGTTNVGKGGSVDYYDCYDVSDRKVKVKGEGHNDKGHDVERKRNCTDGVRRQKLNASKDRTIANGEVKEGGRIEDGNGQKDVKGQQSRSERDVKVESERVRIKNGRKSPAVVDGSLGSKIAACAEKNAFGNRTDGEVNKEVNFQDVNREVKKHGRYSPAVRMVDSKVVWGNGQDKNEEPKTKGILKSSNVVDMSDGKNGGRDAIRTDATRTDVIRTDAIRTDLTRSDVTRSDMTRDINSNVEIADRRSTTNLKTGKVTSKKISKTPKVVDNERMDVSGNDNKTDEQRKAIMRNYILEKDKNKSKNTCENDFQRFRSKWLDSSTPRSVNIDDAIKERLSRVQSKSSENIDNLNESDLFQTIEIKPLKSKLLEPVIGDKGISSSLVEKCDFKTFIENEGETFA